LNVLYLTAEVPYPLTSGYLRHYHLLKGLARRHALTLLSLTRRPHVPLEAHTALSPLAQRVEVFGGVGAADGGLHRALRLRLAAGELRGAVATHLAKGATDVVVLSGKDTFPAVHAIRDVPLVVDFCDAASLRLRGELAVAPVRRRLALAWRLARMEHVERCLSTRTQYVLYATERDRAAVGAAHGIVVPNGVDLDFWTRRAASVGTATVAFSGVMGYRPNHDAALRLVTQILPRVRERVPEAAAIVAGRDPRPALRAAAEGRADVMLTGACTDLRPHLEEAAVYCAPLRFASGIQNKLLEAMAMELPVVTTEVAASGLRAAGRHPPLIVADDDASLAVAIARLLGDPAERARLGFLGRRYVERHFSWAASVALLDATLYAAAGEQGRP
jgi:glycosyltransferase involved in cell wall biosynthesis